MHKYSVVVLWDIDGTLLRTDGAGRRAFARALRRWTRQAVVPRGRAWAGRSDALWLRLVARRCGIPVPPWETFVRVYVRALRKELARCPARSLPGAATLVHNLAYTPGVYQALLTGNSRRAAALKLRSAGYELRFFRGGVFGDRPVARHALARHARRRVERVLGAAVGRWVVVGDTPRDIAAARAIGAASLGVATGGYTVAELEAAGATLAVEDLTATSELLAWILGR